MRQARFDTMSATSSEYLIGAGVRHHAKVRDALAHRPLVVVVDPVVARIQRHLVAPFVDHPACLGVLALGGGEQCKTFDQLKEVLDFFERCRLPKHGVVLAIGGGTLSDVAGLAALLIRRSVALVLMPTTLLAQVDAAIGGKNGINSAATKNLVGSFCQPEIVVCDQDFLPSLSARQIVGGVAESVKVFAVADPDALVRHSGTWREGSRADPAAWEHAVWDAVDCKLRLLADDPYERSSRRLLNYGHTVAHLLEEKSGFLLSHGEAVLLGMLVENDVSAVLGIGGPALGPLQTTITDLLTADCYDHWVAFDAVGDELDNVRHMRRGQMNLICLVRPGEAVIVDDVPPSVMRQAWSRTGARLAASRAECRSRVAATSNGHHPRPVPTA